MSLLRHQRCPGHLFVGIRDGIKSVATLANGRLSVTRGRAANVRITTVFREKQIDGYKHSYPAEAKLSPQKDSWRKQIHHNYSRNNHLLLHVNSAKYLGCITNNTLDWGQHITSVTTVSCQLDAFQMDAVNFQRAINKTRSSWTRPNETRPR